MFIVAMASVSAAAAPIFAERALKARHWAKLGVLMLGFLLMAAYSLCAGIDRIGTKRDNEAASARLGNEQVKLDREAYDMAKQAKEAECIAGLWERWGPDNLLTCTIITTDAVDGIRDLHTRMPVILPKDGFEPWLSGTDPVVDSGIDAAVEVRPVSPTIEVMAPPNRKGRGWV